VQDLYLERNRNRSFKSCKNFHSPVLTNIYEDWVPGIGLLVRRIRTTHVRSSHITSSTCAELLRRLKTLWRPLLRNLPARRTAQKQHLQTSTSGRRTPAYLARISPRTTSTSPSPKSKSKEQSKNKIFSLIIHTSKEGASWRGLGKLSPLLNFQPLENLAGVQLPTPANLW